VENPDKFMTQTRKARGRYTALKRLANSLAGEKAAATFACGGTIVRDFITEKEAVPPQDLFLVYEDKSGNWHRFTFPATLQDMEKLASDCDPATFGVGGEDRFDTEYRSAWKLDKTKFATSFHPFDSDIMEVVKNLLFSGAINLGVFEPILVAQLDKLNVHSLTFPLTFRFTRALHQENFPRL
jgi:hypothetical protein